jgi:2'-5' RNA ligase
MLSGVVSLLDEARDQRVRALWLWLERLFGVANPHVTHFPHFSYHIAPEYDRERVTAVLKRVAGETAVFTIQTTGLAVFTGPQPVLYLPVTRSPALAALHQALWAELESASRNSVPYYAPDAWTPHITLGHGDINERNLGPIAQWLNGQSLRWQITIDNVSVIQGENGRYTLPYRFALRKEP